MPVHRTLAVAFAGQVLTVDVGASTNKLVACVDRLVSKEPCLNRDIFSQILSF